MSDTNRHFKFKKNIFLTEEIQYLHNIFRFISPNQRLEIWNGKKFSINIEKNRSELEGLL